MCATSIIVMTWLTLSLVGDLAGEARTPRTGIAVLDWVPMMMTTERGAGAARDASSATTRARVIETDARDSFATSQAMIESLSVVAAPDGTAGALSASAISDHAGNIWGQSEHFPGFNAEEAKRIGLVSEVCEDVEARAMALAMMLASKSPLAVRGTKRVLLRARDEPDVARGLNYVATHNAAMLMSDDLNESLKARFEKRAPVYSKL